GAASYRTARLFLHAQLSGSAGRPIARRTVRHTPRADRAAAPRRRRRGALPANPRQRRCLLLSPGCDRAPPRARRSLDSSIFPTPVLLPRRFVRTRARARNAIRGRPLAL